MAVVAKVIDNEWAASSLNSHLICISGNDGDFFRFRPSSSSAEDFSSSDV